MNPERFYQIIKKHFEKDNVSNYYGIKLKPVFNNETNRTEIKFSNPDDLSFNYSCVLEHFWEECELFSRVLGISDKKNSGELQKYITIKHPKANEFYFNESDKKKIDELFKSVNYFKSDSKGIDIEADLEFVKGDLYANTEMIDIHAKYIFNNIRNKKRQFSYETNLEFLRNWVYDDFGNYDDEVWDMLNPLVSFIQNNPLLYYKSAMYINANITPIAFHSDGRPLAI